MRTGVSGMGAAEGLGCFCLLRDKGLGRDVRCCGRGRQACYLGLAGAPTDKEGVRQAAMAEMARVCLGGSHVRRASHASLRRGAKGSHWGHRVLRLSATARHPWHCSEASGCRQGAAFDVSEEAAEKMIENIAELETRGFTLDRPTSLPAEAVPQQDRHMSSRGMRGRCGPEPS